MMKRNVLIEEIKSHDVLTDVLDPHTLSILISDWVVDLHPMAAYSLVPQENLRKDGWARAKISHRKSWTAILRYPPLACPLLPPSLVGEGR